MENRKIPSSCDNTLKEPAKQRRRKEKARYYQWTAEDQQQLVRNLGLPQCPPNLEKDPDQVWLAFSLVLSPVASPQEAAKLMLSRFRDKQGVDPQYYILLSPRLIGLGPIPKQ